MRTVFLLFAAFVTLGSVARASESGKGFETASVNIGYMSQEDLGARVGVPELADYFKKLQAICEGSLADDATPENLDIVVAVRANQQARVWFVSSNASADSVSRDQLRAKLEAVAPPKLSGGPIAFAIQGRIAGGVPRVPQAGAPSTPGEQTYTPGGTAPKTDSGAPVFPPTPSEWNDVVRKQGRTLKFDELISLVWPGTSTPAATPGDGFTVPPGIRYHPTSDDKNEQAKKLLTERFSTEAKDADVLLLFENHVICGPGLWADIKTNPEMAKLTKGNVTLNEGTLKLEGKLFQSPDEILAFWRAFKPRTDLTGLKIRKLNPDELKTFWAMISFDIDEPVFIVETAKNKILVNFTPEEKILWIDDYQNFPAHQ